MSSSVGTVKEPATARAVLAEVFKARFFAGDFFGFDTVLRETFSTAVASWLITAEGALSASLFAVLVFLGTTVLDSRIGLTRPARSASCFLAIIAPASKAT
ncbi:MAG: hypothetical protein ACJ8M1_07080 [Chthoniobacterales bacterium]